METLICDICKNEINRKDRKRIDFSNRYLPEKEVEAMQSFWRLDLCPKCSLDLQQEIRRRIKIKQKGKEELSGGRK